MRAMSNVISIILIQLLVRSLQKYPFDFPALVTSVIGKSIIFKCLNSPCYHWDVLDKRCLTGRWRNISNYNNAETDWVLSCKLPAQFTSINLNWCLAHHPPPPAATPDGMWTFLGFLLMTADENLEYFKYGQSFSQVRVSDVTVSLGIRGLQCGQTNK